MIQVSVKDFADYVAKNELASKPINLGQVRLEMHADPVADTIRYVVVFKDKTSRPIKKLSYALDMFNNIEDHIGEDGNFDAIDSMILSANRFA